MPKRKYLKVKEIAQKLRVNCRTVYRYLQSGYLECIKPAGIIYVTRQSYERFIKLRKNYINSKTKTKKTRKGPRRMNRRTSQNNDNMITNSSKNPELYPNIKGKKPEQNLS